MRLFPGEMECGVHRDLNGNGDVAVGDEIDSCAPRDENRVNIRLVVVKSWN